MSMGQYIGVNGVARKINAKYVGINGVARAIQKEYLGVNGVAREITCKHVHTAECYEEIKIADKYVTFYFDSWVGDPYDDGGVTCRTAELRASSGEEMLMIVRGYYSGYPTDSLTRTEDIPVYETVKICGYE